MTTEGRKSRRPLEALTNETLNQPLSQSQRDQIDTFLAAERAHHEAVIALERSLHAPLANYHDQRLFYQDVSDLTHFRRNFFTRIGRFLQKSVAATYQLEFWDRDSHQKYCFPQHELSRADACDIKTGTAVETLTYVQLGYKMRRTYDIQNHHLYQAKIQFYVEGQPCDMVDGLMLLQQRLESRSVWLKAAILHIKDFT